MRLTQHTDYALRLLIALAVARRAAGGTADGGMLTIRAVAERYAISRNHLMKVANELTRLGLVEGTRGRGGGLRLAAAPEAVNVGALVRALEDGRDLVECFRPETDACLISPACRLKGVLAQAQEAFLGVLDAWTLADLVAARPEALAGLLGLEAARP